MSRDCIPWPGKPFQTYSKSNEHSKYSSCSMPSKFTINHVLWLLKKKKKEQTLDKKPHLCSFEPWDDKAVPQVTGEDEVSCSQKSKVGSASRQLLAWIVSLLLKQIILWAAGPPSLLSPGSMSQDWFPLRFSKKTCTHTAASLWQHEPGPSPTHSCWFSQNLWRHHASDTSTSLSDLTEFGLQVHSCYVEAE